MTKQLAGKRALVTGGFARLAGPEASFITRAGLLADVGYAA
jgi:hypothetical protein